MNPTLFDLPPSPPSLPHNGTKTSREAAQTKHASGSADSDRNRIVVDLFKTPAGKTRAQLAHDLGIKPDSVRPRCCELIEAGWLRETGETRVWNGHGKSKVLVHRTHAGGQQ